MINIKNYIFLLKKLLLFCAFCILLLVLFIAFILYTRSENYNIKTTGKLFVINKLGKSVTVFDLEKGKELAEIPLGTEPREIVSFNDGKNVAFTNYGDNYLPGKSITILNVKDLANQKKIQLTKGTRPYGIAALHKDYKLATVTNGGNSFVILNTKTDSVETVIPTKEKISHMLVLHPTKTIAYVTNRISGTVSVIDYKLQKIIKTIKSGLGAEGIDITPNGDEIWVTNTLENTISVINTTTYKVDETLIAGKEAYRLKFTLDGKHCIVTNAKDGTIYIFDRFTKHRIKTIMLNGKSSFLQRVMYHTPRPVGITLHPNKKYAFIANSNADKVEVLNLNSLKVVSNINTGRVPDAMTIVD